LREVIGDHGRDSDALIEKGRNLVADIEDEPDGKKGGGAIEIGLEKISHYVAIEKSHLMGRGNRNSQRSFAALKMTAE
jgi:hypothetical protein